MIRTSGTRPGSPKVSYASSTWPTLAVWTPLGSVIDPRANVHRRERLAGRDDRVALNIPTKAAPATMAERATAFTVVDLWRRSARVYADRLAVVSSEVELTYAELDERTN